MNDHELAASLAPGNEVVMPVEEFTSVAFPFDGFVVTIARWNAFADAAIPM